MNVTFCTVVAFLALNYHNFEDIDSKRAFALVVFIFFTIYYAFLVFHILYHCREMCLKKLYLGLAAHAAVIT